MRTPIQHVVANFPPLMRCLVAPMAALLLAVEPSPVRAVPVHYVFELDVTDVYGPPTGWGPGPYSGHFTVDDALIPGSGTASVIASSFEGQAAFGTFGYSRGNTHTLITLNGTVVETYPHTGAEILFEDGLPQGILYTEFHRMTIDLPVFPPPMGGSALLFSGGTWEYQEPRSGIGGTLTIAVPEPASAWSVLLGLGLLLAAVSSRNRRRDRDPAS